MADAESGSWLTMKEACAHLKVSHMTIRRWMKAGRLACFKFGSGLRFRKEDLDRLAQRNGAGTETADAGVAEGSAAVDEKGMGSAGAADAAIVADEDKAAAICPACGHGEMIQGRLQSTGRLYFKPAKTRFFTFHEAMIPTEALMCSACGHVQLFADTDKLEKLR